MKMVLKSPDIKCLKNCCNPAIEVSPVLPIDNRTICKDGDITKIRIGQNGPIYVPNEKAIIEIPSYPDVGDLGDRMTEAEGAIEAIEDEIGDESSPGTILAKIADNTGAIEALEDEVGEVGEVGTIRDDISKSVKNVSIADQITSSSFVRLITVEKNDGRSETNASSAQLFHTSAVNDAAKKEGMSRYGIGVALAGKQDAGNYATQTDLAQGLATRQPICSTAQQNALDSGITAAKVNELCATITDITAIINSIAGLTCNSAHLYRYGKLLMFQFENLIAATAGMYTATISGVSMHNTRSKMFNVNEGSYMGEIFGWGTTLNIQISNASATFYGQHVCITS